MEIIKRSVLGTVSEVLGPGPGPSSPPDPLFYVNFDKGVRANYSPSSIQAQYEALGREYKDIFDGYAPGINTRIEELLANQAALLPKQYTDYGFMPSSQWTGFDVIMIFVGTVCNRYSDFTSALQNLTLLSDLKKIHSPENAWKIFSQLQWVNGPG